MAFRRPRRRTPRKHWLRSAQLQRLESRCLMAGDLPMGITSLDTGEVLLGTVGVTPVFFESDGSIDENIRDWTPAEIQARLAKITEGVEWWSRALDQMNTVHTVDFVVDDTYAVDPFETGYEAIDHASSTFSEYVGAFLTAEGYGDASSIESAARQFNQDQRYRLGTDWAFTIFVVDSTDDDGVFNGGPFSGAFAFPGGLFMVVPSERPASTFAHEMGHIFWARDEYPGAGSYTDRRGYYNAQNTNAADNPNPGFVQEISIMRGGVPLAQAYESLTSPASTFALVGWRDSDGDGIFDVADVPLELDAIGYFDPATSLYHVTGSASAVPLMNRNSSGIQSDLTFNRVSELQYRLDDGPWMTAAAPDQQQVSFDTAILIEDDFQTIHWRVIDTNVGVTSEVVSVGKDQHVFVQSAIQGFAYLDENANATRDANELLIDNAQVFVRNADGTPLFGGQHAATDFPPGEIDESTAGVHFSARGLASGPNIGSFESSNAGDRRVFQHRHTTSNTWLDSWNKGTAFVAEFDQSVGEVTIGVVGLGDGTYARVEAYDSSNNLISRVTNDLLAAGESDSLTITDASANIAKVHVYGHAETSVAIEHIQFGSNGLITTDTVGAWKIANLPDGDYQVELQPQHLIHQFNTPVQLITVTDGQSETIIADAARVVSARHNVLLPEDVSQGEGVTSRDALLVINDLNLFGARMLGVDEADGDKIDVNNDGSVSALDALLVINALIQEDSEGEAVAPAAFGLISNNSAANDAVISGWGGYAMGAMLDSADQEIRSESTDPVMTDTDNELLASNLRQQSWTIPETGENTTISAETDGKNEEFVPQTINMIAPEIPEPLAQMEV